MNFLFPESPTFPPGESGGLLLRCSRIIRVYTKSPGKKTDNGHPYTVFHGQTVEDVCLLVHKDFYENLHYARLWRGSNNPVTVSRNETVMDGDIIELHI